MSRRGFVSCQHPGEKHILNPDEKHIINPHQETNNPNQHVTNPVQPSQDLAFDDQGQECQPQELRLR